VFPQPESVLARAFNEEGMAANQVRLDELLARQVDVQWFEGVAIVQAICRQLLARGVSNGEFPVATQIGISADGSVRVLDTTSTKAVAAAAHLLAGLLSDDVPVRLRLVVSQATGENSASQDLREFSEALGYFERPDGELIVRHLLHRAMLAAPRKQADEPRSEQVHPHQKSKTAANKSTRDKKATLRLAAVVAAVAIIAMSSLVWFGSRGGRVSAAFSGITNVFANAPEARLNEPLENSNSTKATAAQGSAQPHRTHSSVAAMSHGQPGEARRESPGATAARISSLVPSVTWVRSGVPSPGPPSAPEAAQTYVIIASEPGVSASSLIYSKADAAVTPPRQVYPALPTQPAADVKRAFTVVDLVIAPDGLVERVHLRTPPRNIHEFMLLSAAKAWRFEPALLDGRPVRFLHSVALTSFQ
jgi:hypothetical protein